MNDDFADNYIDIAVNTQVSERVLSASELQELIHDEVRQLIINIQALDEQIKEKELVRNKIRMQLEKLVDEHGDFSIEEIGVVKMIAESSSTSFDSKEVQKVIDDLMMHELHKYASALVKAKKTTTRKRVLRISKWKEKAE